MKPKVVKHLSNIEIDEISLVDRGANQHATIAIAKRAPEEEEMPELYNEDGSLLDEAALNDGDIVFDVEGNAYQFTEDDEVDDEVFDEDRELAEVGKRGGLGAAAENFRLGWHKPNLPGGAQYSTRAGRAGQSANNSWHNAKQGYTRGNGDVKPKTVAGKAGRAARKVDNVTGHPNKELAQLIGGGAAVTAAGYGGYKGYEHMKKSFSDEVMEELSKAYSDEERDQVISKALGRVEELEAQFSEAAEIAKSERDLRLTGEYISKAAQYNLPVDPAELGPVLYRMAETMDYEDCAVINKALEAAGSAIFDEVGYIGGGDNVDVLDQVNAAASEYVGKSAGSAEEAWEQVFEANPAAYDEYLAQRRGY